LTTGSTLIVLGCTHFPYFTSIFRGIFPEEVDIISGSVGTAKNLRRILQAKNQINDGTGDITFFESGYKVEDEDTLSNYRLLLDILDAL
jgi:glutamate racemase